MKIIRKKISNQELIKSAEFIFNKKNYDEEYYIIKEAISIGKRDCSRFVGICNYYIEQDYERFRVFFKPMLEDMINSYIVK